MATVVNNDKDNGMDVADVAGKVVLGTLAGVCVAGRWVWKSRCLKQRRAP
ncbi:MAG: hypothetical protein ACREHG_02260 [Candidatus Saccharimonadales bacterium]